MKTFPLPSESTYSYAQAWSASHRGTDVFASRGMPVLAVDDGSARAATDPKGGKVVFLTATDGTKYYYAHLDDWAPGLEPDGEPLDVESGAMLGLVGSSGNAVDTPTHLHFQISKNGETVDPFPFLVAVDPRAPKRQPSRKGTALLMFGLAALFIGAALKQGKQA